MPRPQGLSLVESVKKNLKSDEEYFCLELENQDKATDIIAAVSLLKEIKYLDIQFLSRENTDIVNLSYLAHALPKLANTKIEQIDLSCNGLAKLGINGLEALLKAMPSNVKTLVLSGNGWGQLGLTADEFLSKIRKFPKIAIKFEGTDAFEREVTKKQVNQNSSAFYKETNQDIQKNSTNKKGPFPQPF